MEKIDHVFCTNSWEDTFPSCFLTALGSAVSDHCSLLLDLIAELQFGHHFRFEAFWPKAEGFFQMVEEAWMSVPSVGNPFMVLDSKLRAMAKRLQSWSARWIGNIKMQILIALEVIHLLDLTMEEWRLSHEEFHLRKVLKCKLLGLCSLERPI